MTKNPSNRTGQKALTREERLKAALKANMGRRKAQARAKAAAKASSSGQDKDKGDG